MKNSVVQYLDIAAEKWPDSITFSDKKGKVTFSDYRLNALRIGTYLINECSVFREPIAVYLPKTVMATNVFMGVLYSGNCYCPIPFRSPVDRAKRILEISKAPYVITDNSHLNIVKTFGVSDEKILLVEELLKTAYDIDLINSCVSKVIDTDPAYVLFTSGSTGLPKGVTIPHRAIIDYMEWVTEEFNIDSSYVFGNQAPFHFDASMPDIYMPLFSGSRVHILSEQLFMLPGRLVDEINNNSINSLIWVPSALMTLTNREVFSKKTINELRLCMFCGEVMPNKHLNVWRKYYPNAVYVNLYGPTEAAYACTYYVIDRLFEDSEALPLGKPCRNTDILIITDDGKRVTEPGTIGELCIRGSSLALGYYSQMTNEAFTVDPTNRFYPEIIYHTGDLGYINEFGELMFSGRKDFQIKHLGYRIELGEIETAVSSVSGIRNVACLYDFENSEIVAFIEGDSNIDRDYVINSVTDLIPKYMYPSRVIRFDKMPMNMNGKIDRVALRNEL
ncbi:MAG: amino acid adenylation domain-containing protein [Eubacterium sp.]|nr:amino acid adenylation domain-containing protein [Eubacterium sp.]